MGLDTTHDCWHGSYSSFNEFRRSLAQSAGWQLEEMSGFGGVEPWPDKAEDALVILLNHSDCEGEIAVDDLLPLAKRLREIDDGRDAWRAKAVRQFATGLEMAAKAGEPVEFH